MEVKLLNSRPGQEMAIHVARVLSFAYSFVLCSSFLHAAVTRIEPFVGQHQESWETFPNFNSTVDTLGHRYFFSGPTSIFDGMATITHPKMGVFEPLSANYNLGSSGRAQVAHGAKGLGLASTGPQILPEYIESAAITFAIPIAAFGGYWGAGTDYLFDPEVIEFQFFDAGGNLIGSDARPYTRSFLIDETKMIFSGDGELLWSGWQFDTPVQRIVFGGGAIVADYLQVNYVPEASSFALLLTSVVCVPILMLVLGRCRRPH